MPRIGVDRMKEKIKRIIEKIKDIFSLHCPECGGRMKSEYLDMEIDHMVYKCTKCGSKENLHAHHIIRLYDICEQYNMNADEILNSEEFHDINNGITLCQNCHALEHPYISRDEKGRFISRSKTKPQKS